MNNKKISLTQLENIVYRQEDNFILKGMELLIDLFGAIEQTAGFSADVKSRNNINTDRTIYYTRIAAALTAFFLSPQWSLNKQGYQFFINHKKNILMIFELSGYQGTDHILALLGSKDKNSNTKFQISTQEQLMKFLIFYSLNSEVELDFESLLIRDPEIVLPAYINLLTESVVLNSRVSERKEKLLKIASVVENIALDKLQISRLATLWMFCSYSTYRDKHKIKKYFNVAIQKYLKRSGIVVPEKNKYSLKEKPRIVFPLEKWIKSHAMYRSYYPILTQLKDKYELVAIVTEDCIDDESSKIFDKVIKIDKLSTTAKKIVGKVIKQQPDIIYYLSLGMNDWTILLANLRLAPIQILSLGHPASSYSQYIDYVLMNTIMYDFDNHCYSEIAVLHDDNNISNKNQKNIDIQPNIRENPEKIKLLVTSTIIKLNYEFLSVCMEIKKQSDREIEFHFFPSGKGIAHDRISQQIQLLFPDAFVYHGSSYSSYMKNINECDIHLSPFPFGGANSNIDSMQLGIPLVSKIGSEPHSRTDAIFHDYAGLPDWMLTNNDEDYIKAALRLINNDSERIEISNKLINLDSSILMKEDSYDDESYLKSIDWIYHNHDAIKQSRKKVWTYEEQLELEKQKEKNKLTA